MQFSDNLRFDSSAQELFDQWRSDLEVRIRAEEDSMIESHLAKFRSLLPSIALLLHLAEVFGSDGKKIPVTSSPTSRAIDWCTYLESHARRIYGMGSLAEVEGAKSLLKKLKQGTVPQTFTARMVYQNHWSRLATSEDVNSACSILADHGYLCEREIRGKGRPSTEYTANPKIFERVSSHSTKSSKRPIDTFGTDVGTNSSENLEVSFL